MPLPEFRKEFDADNAAMEEASTTIGGPNAGDWIVLGLVGRFAVPIMEPKKRMVMRNYRTPEEAIAASVEHSSTRVGGGWAVNIRTGEMVAIHPFGGDRHV